MPNTTPREIYQLPVYPVNRLEKYQVQKFLADEDEKAEQHFEIGPDGEPKLFTMVTKDDTIFFCKRIMVTKKLVRKPLEVWPRNMDHGPDDEYIAWQPTVMKRPCHCRVIGTKKLTNGIKHNWDDPKYTIMKVPRFEPLEHVQALLVVQGMNSTPFLIPHP